MGAAYWVRSCANIRVIFFRSIKQTSAPLGGTSCGWKSPDFLLELTYRADQYPKHHTHLPIIAWSIIAWSQRLRALKNQDPRHQRCTHPWDTVRGPVQDTTDHFRQNRSKVQALAKHSEIDKQSCLSNLCMVLAKRLKWISFEEARNGKLVT